MEQTDNQSIEKKKSDHEILEEIIERLSDDALLALIEDIKDEQELRKLKANRIKKMRDTLKIEKNNIIKELKKMKLTMIQADEYSSDDGVVIPKKKTVKRK